MSTGSGLIAEAYAAHGRGTFGPLVEALHPDVVWLGIEGQGENGETACCEDRARVLDRLTGLYERGRRFRVVEQVEQGRSVATGIEVFDPLWGGTVTVWKLFSLDPASGSVVRIQDCVGRDEALAALGAS